jgi:hypothetical protein
MAWIDIDEVYPQEEYEMTPNGQRKPHEVSSHARCANPHALNEGLHNLDI